MFSKLFNHQSSTLIIAIVFNVLAMASITICRTYVDVLFLSTYEVSILPYFFLGQTALILVVTIAITPLAKKASSIMNASVFIISALLVFNGAILLKGDIRHFAFIFSLVLAVIPVILTVVSLNVVAEAFDVRNFKKLVVYITAAGSLGGLGMGLLIPLISSFFQAQTLLYIFCGLALLVGAIIPLLKPVPVAAKRNVTSQSPLNYPLFRNVALCTFLMMLVDTFADYALKAELGKTFTQQEEIAKFMGPFYGVSHVFMLFFQLVGVQTLIKLAGVAGLLTVIPWFCGFTSLGFMFYPGLLSAALLRFGENTFRFSFFSVGREIALKPLPAQIRRSGKFLITSIGYLGAGCGALILWLFNEQLDPKMLATMVIVISIIWIAVAKYLGAIYQDTLEEAIRIKRFSVTGDDYFSEEKNNVQEVTTLAFQDKDPDSVRFGFTLLKKANLKTLPKASYAHLNSVYPDIRVEFISAASRFHDSAVLPDLLERMKVEQDGRVLWWLLKLLSMMAPAEAVKYAPSFLSNPDPLARAGAVVALLSGGNLDQLVTAGSTLKDMLHSEIPGMRKGAAYALSALNIGRLEKELHTLLVDPEESVSIAAMWALADQKNIHLIGALTAKLGHGRASHYASRTLKSIGPPVIPYLSKIIEMPQYNQKQQGAARAAVRILMSFSEPDADQAILHAAQTGSVLIRTLLAKECAMRVRHHPNSPLLVRSAGQFVQGEAQTVLILKNACKSQALCRYTRLELMQRQKMAEARLLYWLNVCTRSEELLGVIPVLLNVTDDPDSAARYATALEFLDTLGKDKSLRQAVRIFENDEANETEIREAVDSLGTIDDVWLQKILKAKATKYTGGPMDITHKVMLIRKVKLFRELPGEILLTIAETCEAREMVKGETLFSQGDLPDGLYIVASGVVGIKKGDVLLTELHEEAFFGELGLFDDSPRKADAVALSDGMVLFLEKEVFDGIAEDLPEVLRALIRTVISYLK